MSSFSPEQNYQLSKKIKLAVDANARHLKMSPETRLMFNNMEKELNEAKTDRAVMKKDIDFIKEEIGELKFSMKDFIECADRKYASKWTEKLLVGFISVIGTLLLTAVMALLLKPDLFNRL